MAQLERALDQVNLRLEHVSLLVCTHAHSDHWGQAAPICDRAGCELWMHPNHEHATRSAADPKPALARRIEVGPPERRPEAALERLRRAGSSDMPSGIARVIEPQTGRSSTASDRHRPRHLDCLRDARPRALARLPVPARAPADDLRRSPPRPHLAVLRLRLDARPGRRVPGLARRRRARSTRGCACRATASRSSTSPATSRATASSSPSACRRCWALSAVSRGRRSRSARGLRRASDRGHGSVAAVADALLPAAPGAAGAVAKVSDSGVERWRAA